MGAEGLGQVLVSGSSFPSSPALPSVCMASSLCCTCWDITRLIPMRFSVMVLDVCARFSLAVFLGVQGRRRKVNKSP